MDQDMEKDSVPNVEVVEQTLEPQPMEVGTPTSPEESNEGTMTHTVIEIPDTADGEAVENQPQNRTPGAEHESQENTAELDTTHLAVMVEDESKMVTDRVLPTAKNEMQTTATHTSSEFERKSPELTPDDYLKRIKASMVLAGVGDSLGYKNSAFEFCDDGTFIHKEVEKMGGVASITVEPKDWIVSDDTVMHIATAEALVSKWDGNYETLYLKLAERYKECMDDMSSRAPGDTCMSWSHKLRPKIHKGYVIPFNPRGGGCGAAMRAVPIGLYFNRSNQINELVVVSIESGRMTHNHPTGYLGALAVALFVSYAFQKKPLVEWGAGLMQTLDIAWEYIEREGRDVEDNRHHWSYFKKRWMEYLSIRGIQDGCSSPRFPIPYDVYERDEFYNQMSFSGWGGASGHDAPMIAYDALLGCEYNVPPARKWSWDELCSRGMFHGGDSDSTGIIAAACWGAMRGFDGVPERNYQYVEYRDRLEKLGQQIHESSSINKSQQVDTNTQVKLADNYLKRFKASMVLAGVGDALGYKNGAYEFCRNGAAINEEVKGKGGVEKIKVDTRNWMVSDDTVMHIATAEALVSKWDTKDYEKLYLKLAEKYKDCMRDMSGRAPGNTCMTWTHKLRPKVHKGYVIPFNPRGGGCGAAMRAVPIGLYFNRSEQINELVAVSIESGRMTHNHPTGYLGALAVALFVSYAFQKKPLVEWGAGLMQTLDIAWEYIKKEGRDVEDNKHNWSYFKERWMEYLEIRGIQDGCSSPCFPIHFDAKTRDGFYKQVSFSGWGGSSGHDAPMIAYDALLGCGESWGELCSRGMFHGGDSDSTGIIAAACWGAMRGFDGVPECNYSHLEYRDRLEKLGKQIHDRVMK